MIPRHPQNRQNASTFVVVLWIALGLVSLTLYFGQTMTFELRAADNRVSALAAEQAIDGAARYAVYVLANLETNGAIPDPAWYAHRAAKVGEAQFWFIGRDTNNNAAPLDVSFGLVDEGGKLNLNYAPSNELVWLPDMNLDLTAAILDWRDTNGGTGEFQTQYGMRKPPYVNKSAPFETVDELRLLYGANQDLLYGEDLNRNGVLDPNEQDYNHNGRADPGLLEYLTVYSREPNTYSNGTARINISNLAGNSGTLATLLQGAVGTARADIIMTSLGLLGSTGGGPGNRPPGGNQGGGQVGATFRSPLEFYRRSQMTVDEFATVGDAITVTNGSYIYGRVNINTASEAVLACLPGFQENPDLAGTLVDYRLANPGRLNSIAWVVEALGQNNTEVLDRLQASDCITTRSYQYSADVAALGPNGRGYQRVRFIIDAADATPRILFRQDLTHLGWALGKNLRQTLLTRNEKQ